MWIFLILLLLFTLSFFLSIYTFRILYTDLRSCGDEILCFNLSILFGKWLHKTSGNTYFPWLKRWRFELKYCVMVIIMLLTSHKRYLFWRLDPQRAFLKAFFYFIFIPTVLAWRKLLYIRCIFSISDHSITVNENVIVNFQIFIRFWYKVINDSGNYFFVGVVQVKGKMIWSH